MTSLLSRSSAAVGDRPPWAVVSAVGLAQIFAWGSSYYLPAVLSGPIATSTGWPRTWVVGGLSLGLLVSGLASPRVGKTIEHVGGRPVLATSALLLAAGLLGLAASRSTLTYLAAWLVIGLGMGTGLYDPAFATLGRTYGDEARPLITGVTLWGGFASTVCWPLSAFLVSHVGWRGTCVAYAGLHLAVTLPLYLRGLPRETRRPAPTQRSKTASAASAPRVADHRYTFALLAIGLTLASVIMTVVSVELLAVLEAHGMSTASAVALGALVGPSQVAARVVEHMLARRRHPIWSMLAAMLLVAVGLGMLLLGPGVVAVGLVLYGAGGGIRSIARGTVPLALFGREGYATLIGKLAMPMLVAQAASPAIGAVLLGAMGATGIIVALAVAACINIVPVVLLLPVALRSAAKSVPVAAPPV